jgi:bifunctional polynucleotide phosphatase/kinase
MGLSPQVWSGVSAAVMAFCAERPPLLCDLNKRPRQAVLLVGLPGCGKSTACQAVAAAGLPYVRVNQDTLGTRQKCLAAAEKALAAGRDVIIDRCNVSFQQRLPFLQLAAKHQCAVRCIVLQAPPDVCVARAAARPDHETIPGGDEHKARAIIHQMQRELAQPQREEGIHRICFVETTHEGWIPQFLQLLQEKE